MVILEEGESVIKVGRKHWFVLLPISIILFALAGLPPIVFGFLFSQTFAHLASIIGISDITNIIGSRLEIFAYSLWLLILWTIFFVDWTDYYLDMLLITNRRVVSIEQRGFFNREVISFNYGQIQDITVQTRGILQTYFKFGFIQIQTAGERSDIIIRNAADPESLRAAILSKTPDRPVSSP